MKEWEEPCTTNVVRLLYCATQILKDVGMNHESCLHIRGGGEARGKMGINRP